MTKFLLLTTMLATLGFGFTSTARTEITPITPITPTDETTGRLAAAVSISNGFNHVTNLGDGQFQAEMGAQGTLSTPNGTFNTGFLLDCDVDTVGETVDCAGQIRVGTNEVPFAVAYADGSATYRLHQSASENQRRAWVSWHEVRIIDILPPDVVIDIDSGAEDDAAEDDLGDGGEGGWEFPTSW